MVGGFFLDKVGDRNMAGRYTIRPQIEDGESLTSYIFRLAKKNACDYSRVISPLKNTKDEVRDRSFRLEIIKEDKINFSELCRRVNKSVEDILSMTFLPVVQNCLNSGYYSREQLFQMLTSLIHTTVRFFCPQCLAQKVYYKLIWQVKEIEICDEHLCKLQSRCSECQKEQPYLADSLVIAQCKYCGSYLNKINATKKEEQPPGYITAQKRRYSNWRYLMGENNRIVRDIQGVPVKKHIAIALMYCAQIPEETYNYETLKHALRDDYIHSVRRFINDHDSPQYVTLQKLLRFLNLLNMSVQSFSQVKVPRTFINSITDDYVTTREYICLTPWCSSFGTSFTMNRIPHCDKTVIKKVKYYNVHVCTTCYMRYGVVTHKGQWEQMGNVIGCLETLRKLMSSGLSYTQIANQLSITRVILYKYVGYLLQHKLLEKEYLETLTPKEVPHNLVESFKQLVALSGDTKTSAKKLYGWGEIEYSFYQADVAVQNYLIFESHRDKSRYSQTAKDRWKLNVEKELIRFKAEDKDISIKYIANSVNCSTILLGRYGLRELIEQARKDQRVNRLLRVEKDAKEKITTFLDCSFCNNKDLTVQEIYRLIDIKRNYADKYFPALADWIKQQVSSYTHKRSIVKLEETKKMVKETVRDCFLNNVSPSVDNVIKRLGLHHNYKYYKEVKIAIQHARTELGIKLVQYKGNPTWIFEKNV